MLNCTIGKSVEENLIWNKRIFLGVAEEHVSKRWPFNYFQSCEFAGQSLERGQNSSKNSRPKCVNVKINFCERESVDSLIKVIVMIYFSA